MTIDERIALLNDMQEHACVSGLERDLSDYLAGSFSLRQDKTGNLYTFIKGRGQDKRSVLLEAHLDEIGFVVSDLTDDGFPVCQMIGGFSRDYLPGTEVTVFARKPFQAVIGSKPPHLSKIKTEEAGNDAVFLAAGFTDKTDAGRYVLPGTPVHFYGPTKRMDRDFILSRGLDNKASVLALLEVINRMKSPYHDVTVLLSVGEETTGLGAKVFTNNRRFDLALVVDAGFGAAEGLDPTRTLKMGGGPSVSFTEQDTISLVRRVAEIASKCALPCQIIAEPGGTGTDSAHIHTRAGGIPTAVVSIPILNMHSRSEIVADRDISYTVDLLTAVVNEPDLSYGKEVSYLAD